MPYESEADRCEQNIRYYCKMAAKARRELQAAERHLTKWMVRKAEKRLDSGHRRKGTSEDLALYQIAQRVTDKVLGKGTYKRINKFDPSRGETSQGGKKK